MPPRTRLLTFVSSLALGGTERQAVNLTLGVDAATFEPHLACFDRFDRSGGLLHEMEGRRIPLEEYPIDSLHNRNTVAQQLKLARYIRRNGIHIVHAWGFYANVFAVPAARLVGVPVLASIRDMGDIWSPMQNRVQRWICRLADGVLVNAQAVRQRLIEEGYRQETIAVIPNGIAVSKFHSRRGSGRLHNELGVPPQAPLVAVLSRLNPLKGIEYFLEAAAMLARDFPLAHFLIVGDDPCNQDGPYKRQLEAYGARLGLGRRVTFTGLRHDVPAVLSEITVSVLPSLSEGLSNVLLESMAAGVPVVATRVGGNAEAVEEGITGLLTPPRDAAALARAIGQLLADPELADRFGRAGRQRVAERFALQGAVDQTARYYLDLLRRGGRTAGGIRTDGRARCGEDQLRRAEQRPLTLTVESISDYESFLALEPLWNDLVESAGIDHPFLTHEWVRTWWQCFGAANELHILVVKADREAIAIAPLMLSRERMYGLQMHCLQFIANVYTDRFDFILASRPKEAYGAIWKHIATQKGLWDVLKLCQLPAGSRTLEELPRLATSDGALVGTWRSSDSPYVDLADGWEAYTKRLSHNHRHKGRKQLKRLSQLGGVKLEVISSAEHLDAALNDGYRLEAAGWKTQSGTAVLCVPELKRFLTRLAEAASPRGMLRLIFLTVGPARIAFAYALCYKNKLFVLKAGYDPQYATYSPYNLLCYLVFQDACEQGLAEYEFLGSSDEWKLHWTKKTRPHYWLYIFFPSLRTRLLHSAKFHIVPSIQELRLYRLVRGAVMRLRKDGGIRRTS